MEDRKELVEEILSKLSKTVECNLHHYDATVCTFIELLIQNSNDPLSVIDVMFVHYSKIIKEQDEQIKNLLLGVRPIYEIKFENKEQASLFLESIEKKE